ncbi:MAG: energy-coupling factor ABC transporter ATP-binding protein [Candidatus Helarchaeota archaeon]
MELKNKHIIEVEEITYAYPDKTIALRDISFSIKTGECIGVIGPNGAGKSTLFLVLMGFLQPQKGKVFIDNQQLTKKTRKDLRKKIGMVFQDPNDQLFSPTLWEDVAFGPYNLGYDGLEINKRVEETLTSVGLLAYKDKAPHLLSFGEKKKAALATILSMDPKILFLDEPLSNLDPESYTDILKIIKKYKKEGLTIIIATHDLDILPRFIDRCILLDNGQIISNGSTQQVLTDYELLTNHRLRMPILGQFFYNLKKRNIISVEELPLTLSQAEAVLEKLIHNGID